MFTTTQEYWWTSSIPYFKPGCGTCSRHMLPAAFSKWRAGQVARKFPPPQHLHSLHCLLPVVPCSPSISSKLRRSSQMMWRVNSTSPGQAGGDQGFKDGCWSADVSAATLAFQGVVLIYRSRRNRRWVEVKTTRKPGRATRNADRKKCYCSVLAAELVARSQTDHMNNGKKATSTLLVW